MSAPVTAIIGYDAKFYEQLPKLFPHADARAWFANTPELAEVTARRNSSLQGAYFTIAARALGLDCGPMSGFDQAKVDHEFFPAEKRPDFAYEYFPDSHIKTNFLCNIGYGDPDKLFPRSPRLDFDEACKLVESVQGRRKMVFFATLPSFAWQHSGQLCYNCEFVGA